eukprot:SAG31_NODE_34070_length_337_cov_0.504202_1_plen_50_part_01
MRADTRVPRYMAKKEAIEFVGTLIMAQVGDNGELIYYIWWHKGQGDHVRK